jgi:hypothetical protein
MSQTDLTEESSMATPLGGDRLGAFGFARQVRFASSPQAISSSYTTSGDMIQEQDFQLVYYSPAGNIGDSWCLEE